MLQICSVDIKNKLVRIVERWDLADDPGSRDLLSITMSTSSLRTSSSKPSPLRLNELSPTQFENLIFDLVTAKGMKNVIWRTPGADGGRDIEAEMIGPDFSGFHTSARWFIECKKYRGSVDWPKIYSKVAYADSLGADYLLMCTPSKFTPNAVSEVARWNSARRTLKIRLWAGHHLLQQLCVHPDVERKYGLVSEPSTPGQSIVLLALTLSKTVASHHSALVFSGNSPDRMLLASQALADLLQQRMSDLERAGQVRPVFRPFPIDDRWTCGGSAFKVDFFALQAFLGYLFALVDTVLDINGSGDYACTVATNQQISNALSRYRDAFNSIALWGDFEYRTDSTSYLTINQRTTLV